MERMVISSSSSFFSFCYPFIESVNCSYLLGTVFRNFCFSRNFVKITDLEKEERL